MKIKKSCLILNAVLFVLVQGANARSFKDIQNSVQNTGDGVEITAVTVGTNSVVLYREHESTSPLYRNYRRWSVSNPSTQWKLHISTFQMSVQASSNTPSYEIGVTTMPVNSISLSNGATMYASFEGAAGSFSTNVKVLKEYQK